MNVDENIEMASGSKLEVAVELLKSGKTLSITARGYSMYPTIKPGTKILIRPVTEGRLKEGDVVAFARNGRLVVHRLRKTGYEEGKNLYITRGDSNMYDDMPVSEEALVGYVPDYKTDKAIGKYRYLFNAARVKAIITCGKIRTLLHRIAGTD